jgi:hypothetical protein
MLCCIVYLAPFPPHFALLASPHGKAGAPLSKAAHEHWYFNGKRFHLLKLITSPFCLVIICVLSYFKIFIKK